MYPTTLPKQNFDGSINTDYVGWKNVVDNKNYDTFNLDTSMGQAWIH